MPIMHVVAGPSGSGKTSAFPGDRFGCDYFNADAYAAMLNGGSYVGIPKSIRKEVGPICEKFIQDHVSAGEDFATETTLRSTIVFDQMKSAHDAGFDVDFLYLSVDSIFRSIDRVAQRADMGGHSGSEDTVREIRSKSLGHLPRIFDELGRTVDFLNVYDNSADDVKPKLIASFQERCITFLAPDLPEWLTQSLEQTPYFTERLRECFQRNQSLPDAKTTASNS
jgi:predicted ABC-type ATPase